MVAGMLRGGRTQTGVRPFDPYRDPGPVAELIATAFSGKLGPGGEIALAEMRRVARWGPLLWWLYWPRSARSGVASGFVWVDQERVLGNVSLRRALEWGGFMIGNVAVHPDWQQRGIASALLESALEAITAQSGRWAGLEVRADNKVARQLYEHLGFREVGRTLHMLRPAGLPWTREPLQHSMLRRGHSHDGPALIQLVRTTVPAAQRPLLELRKDAYRPSWERVLTHWLEGRHEVWWVIEENGAICGAVRAVRERGRRPDQLEVLVAPGCSGRFETALVHQGMFSLRLVPKKMIEIVLPSPMDSLVTVLEETGFQKLCTLVQMRLDLARRISVIS